MSADGFNVALRDLVRSFVAEELAKLRTEAPSVLMTTREAADHAKVAMGTVRRWIKEGRLAEHRAGREVRVARADLDRLLHRGVRAPKPSEQSPEQLGALAAARIR